MSLINGKAHNPPGIGLVHEDPPKRSVALDTGHIGAGHDSAPPDRDTVDVGQYPRRHHSSRYLGPERLTAVCRVVDIAGFEKPLAPTPSGVVAAATERDHHVVPTLGGCGCRLDVHDARPFARGVSIDAQSKSTP